MLVQRSGANDSSNSGSTDSDAVTIDKSVDSGIESSGAGSSRSSIEFDCLLLTGRLPVLQESIDEADDDDDDDHVDGDDNKSRRRHCRQRSADDEDDEDDDGETVDLPLLSNPSNDVERRLLALK